MKSLIGLCLLLTATLAQAHRPSDAYLTLEVDGTTLRGQWEIALRDLELAVGLDSDGDGAITWGELRAAQPQLAAMLPQWLQLRSGGESCVLVLRELLVHERLDGRYAWLALDGHCAQAPQVLALEYRFLFEVDPSHRGMLVLKAGTVTHGAVLAPARAAAEFTLAEVSRTRLFGDYWKQGLLHIWGGFDHLLFLIVLLLPGVLRRESGAWQPLGSLREALWPLVGVITAFTLAHSITLSLAALDLLRLNLRWVEAVIAASVVLAALNNLKPLATRRRWALAFGFGLIHGFGFASALGELGLPDDARLLCLLAFNFGVETGQLAVLAVVLPLAWALRATRLYRSVLLPLGSLAVALIAAFWCWQRVTGV